MKMFNKMLFAILAMLIASLSYAQELLDKLKSSQSETRSAAHESAVVIFGYTDIAVGLIVAGWSILSFRNSRQASEDGSGDDFSWVKFVLPKAAILAVYIIGQIITRNILS